MQNKKLFTTLIIAILTFSMTFAFIPMANAVISVPTLTPSGPGHVGDKVEVSGTDATAFSLVEIYWDYVKPWDGVSGYLNETYAETDCSYSCFITVPEVTAGTHYVIALDVVTNDRASSEFSVEPEIILTPTSGLPGDPVAVVGTGFAKESEITITFEPVPVTGEEVGTGPGTAFSLDHYPVVADSETIYLAVTGEDVGTGDGSAITFPLDYNNIVPASETIYLGDTPQPDDGSVYTLDDATGVITFLSAPDTNVAITADYQCILDDSEDYDLDDLTGEIILTSSAPDGAVITADYKYIMDVTPDPAPETSVLGSFEATITVPDVPYADYTVTAEDEVPNSATATFTVTATITLTPNEGPSGTVVAISGIGFTPLSTVTITFDGVSVYWEGAVLPEIDVESDGTFSASFIVPTKIVDTYDVVAKDTVHGDIVATFKVTGTTGIELTPTSGFPSWEVTIEGANFTAIADTKVTVKFGEVTVKTLYTNATGGFLGTFIVPSLPTITYVVKATDANDLEATADFTIAITLIVLDPVEGPTGTEVTVKGYGFTGENANVTFGTFLVLMNEPVTSLDAGTSKFYVPTVPVGEYTVTVKDKNELTASEKFTVNATTTVIFSPETAPPTYEVSVVGHYFSPDSSISFVFYNETANYITKTFSTLDNGTFKGTFIIPEDLALGDYLINVTDTEPFPEDLNLIYVHEIPFSVVKVYIEMHTRATEYLQGHTVSFYIKCTFNYAMDITIKDPTEYPYGSISIEIGDWKELDGYYVVPYADAVFTLPNDAVLGTWNWTATVGEETETGLFDIVKKPTLGIILDRLDELDVKIDGLVSKADDIYVLIDTAKGEVLLKLAELDPKLVDIQDRTIVINTTLGEVRALMEALNLDAINAVITSLNQTIATISTDIGTVTVSIEEIGLKVDAINGAVATIKTDLGTMQGTVTSIDDDVATIKTDVGTVKADVSDIGVDVSDIAEKEVTVDLTAVWIAVVFSILAFLAAIITAYMLRSKLA